MIDIIEIKFQEWTMGLTPVEKRISVFENVRDIPFYIVPELFSLKKGPCRMLELNKGFCVPKHYLLGMIFERLGISVKYCFYPFLWKEIKADFPDDIRKMAENIPVTFHLACKALIDENWVLIDAAWDKVLEKTGLPVNSSWDGFCDTKLGVVSLGEKIEMNLSNLHQTLSEKYTSYSFTDKLELSRFSLAINNWFSRTRQSK